MTTPSFDPRPAARLDFYAPIHKAIRSFMADTLVRVGGMDSADDADVMATMAQLASLVGLMRGHLQHENAFVHPAIEARCQGGSLRIAQEHEEHHQAFDALDTAARQLPQLPAAQRDLAALRLYRQLALFVAENLEHMHIEETVHNPLLWAAYSDEELVAVHDELLASIAPSDMALALHWMAPALSHAELAGMLGGMRAQMPPELFRGVVAQVQPRLPLPRWDKLARALELPLQHEPVPSA